MKKKKNKKNPTTIWAGSVQNSSFQEQPSPSASQGWCIYTAGCPSTSVGKRRDVVGGSRGQSPTPFFQPLGQLGRGWGGEDMKQDAQIAALENQAPAPLKPHSSWAHPVLDALPDTSRRQPLTHTDGLLSAKKARILQREVAWSTCTLKSWAAPASCPCSAIYLTSGSQREPPPGQKQNCSSKLFMSTLHPTKTTTAHPKLGKWECCWKGKQTQTLWPGEQ